MKLKSAIFLLASAAVLTACATDPSITASDSSPFSSSSSSSSVNSSEVADTTKEEILRILQTTPFAIEGTLRDVDYTYSQDFQMGLFEDAYYLSYMEGGEEVETYALYEDDEGYLVVRPYLLPNNTPYEYRVTDTGGGYAGFAENYSNPFLGLTEDDLELEDDGTATLLIDGLSEETLDQIVFVLSGFSNVTIDSFRMATLGGVLSGMAEVTQTYGGTTISYIYSFQTIDPSELNFERVEPLPLTEEHAQLQDLFDSLADQNFTVDVTRTGGIAISDIRYEILSTSDLLVASATNGAGETYYSGLYQSEDGLVHATSDGEYLNATDYPDSDDSIAYYRPDFSLSPAFFEKKEDGKWYLTEDYQSYFYLVSPDAYFHSSYLIYMDSGSFSIELTDQGAIFSYTYSYESYGNIVSGSVTLDVREIGSTANPFTYVPYEEPSYETWDDFGDEVTSVLSTYLEDRYNEVLPFINYLDYGSTSVNWVARSYQGVDYAQLSLVVTDNTADALLDEYVEQLLSIGWEEVDDGQFILSNSAGDGYYHLTVWQLNSRYFYCRLDEMGDSDLYSYISARLGGSINSTVTVTQNTDYYSYDTSTSEIGELYSTSSETTLYSFTSSAVEKIEDYGTEEESNTYFTFDEEGVTVWMENSSGTYNLITSYDGYTADTYTYYGTYPPSGLPDYAAYLTYRSGSDGIFDVPSALVSTIAYAVFGVSSTYSDSVAYLEIDYFSNTFTIVYTYGYVSGDNYVEVAYTAEYSGFGLTSVTLPDGVE